MDQISLPLEPPICAECAYVIGKRSHYESAENWRCDAASNVLMISKDLVTGVFVSTYRFDTCYEAREDHWGTPKSSERVLLSCGKVGQWFLENRKPDYSTTSHNKDADTLLGELEAS